MYVIVCFTHERYMVLLPMFIYCAIVAVKKNWKEFVFPFIALALVIAVRFKMTG